MHSTSNRLASTIHNPVAVANHTLVAWRGVVWCGVVWCGVVPRHGNNVLSIGRELLRWLGRPDLWICVVVGHATIFNSKWPGWSAQAGAKCGQQKAAR